MYQDKFAQRLHEESLIYITNALKYEGDFSEICSGVAQHIEYAAKIHEESSIIERQNHQKKVELILKASKQLRDLESRTPK